MKLKILTTIILAASVSMIGITNAVAEKVVVVKKTSVPLKVHKHNKVYLHDHGRFVTKKVVVKKELKPTPVKKVIVKEKTY